MHRGITCSEAGDDLISNLIARKCGRAVGSALRVTTAWSVDLKYPSAYCMLPWQTEDAQQVRHIYLALGFFSSVSHKHWKGMQMVVLPFSSCPATRTKHCPFTATQQQQTFSPSCIHTAQRTNLRLRRRWFLCCHFCICYVLAERALWCDCEVLVPHLKTSDMGSNAAPKDAVTSSRSTPQTHFFSAESRCICR